MQFQSSSFLVMNTVVVSVHPRFKHWLIFIHLQPVDVFRRQRDMITWCSLSIDREFGLLVGDGLLFTSLSLAGPCKHQWSLFTRPNQQFVRCRIQSLSANRLVLFLWRPAQFQQQSQENDIRPSLFTYPLISPKQRLQVFEILNSSTSVTSNFFCNSLFIPTPRDGAQPFIWSFLDQSPLWRMQSFPYFSSPNSCTILRLPQNTSPDEPWGRKKCCPSGDYLARGWDVFPVSGERRTDDSACRLLGKVTHRMAELGTPALESDGNVRGHDCEHLFCHQSFELAFSSHVHLGRIYVREYLLTVVSGEFHDKGRLTHLFKTSYHEGVI